MSDPGTAFYGRAAKSSLRVNVAGKELVFSTGDMARQASGAVTCVQGDTHVFCSACFEKVRSNPAAPLLCFADMYGSLADGPLKPAKPKARELV